jgi:hypothetical protein
LRLARVNKCAKAADRYCKSSADRFAKRDVQYAVAHDHDDAMPDGTGGDQDRRVKDLEMLKCPAPKARLSKRSGEQETFRGTRASANTSGPDFIRALGPVKLRSKDSAPNEENLFLLPDRF